MVPCTRLRASFTKQRKLVPMGVNISAGDLLTMRKLKTQTQHLISIMTNAIYQAQCKLA